MSGVSVEVVREGEAVIRLDGVFEVPSRTVFVIEPLDDELAASVSPGWPAGELTPVSTRVGAKGVELLIGPEVVDAPRLLPGTPVVISVPGASVRDELRWPSLTLSKSRRRGTAVVTGEQRAADVAARAEQQRAELARIRAARIEAEREQEAAALALLASRRMTESDAAAGHIPALKAQAAAARPVELALSSLIQKGPEKPPEVPTADVPTGMEGMGETSPPPLPAVEPAPAKAADEPHLKAASPPAVEASTAAPPPVPSVAAKNEHGVSDGAKSGTAGGEKGRSVDAPPSPDGQPRRSRDERSAEEILARQVVTRDVPSQHPTSRMQRAFGLGFVIALGLAGVASYVMATGEMARSPQDVALIAQLREEATGLRLRLAGEIEAKRGVETSAQSRVTALEAETASLRERLAAENKRSADDGALAAKLKSAEAEIARQRSALEAEAQRARAGGEALEKANQSLADVARKLAAAEESKRAADGELQRLRAEAEQLRLAADSVLKRQAKEGVRPQPQGVPAAAAAETSGKPASSQAPPTMDPAMKSPGTDGKAAGDAAGKNITLRVKGSEFEISGSLHSFDGKTFVIVAPNVGQMSFDAARVQCSGAGCPKL
ncbi:MAG: hypothetical protein JNM89_13810 [Hyphomicrobiaceae bacterium]|nr:hypothetical protein [Hyphomicrobiaceae bacterium]